MSDQPDRILRIRAVLDRTGLTRSTLYRKMEAGIFPRQIAISTRCVGGREAAVGKWLANPYSMRPPTTPQSQTEAPAKERDDTPPPHLIVAANDGPPISINRATIDATLARIARLIGRQIAREAFEARSAANDNDR